MGQIWLWNLEFIAELWGKNSATDNPPCPMILIIPPPMHCIEAYSSGSHSTLSGSMCSQQLSFIQTDPPHFWLPIFITNPTARKVMLVAQMSMCVGMVVESLEKTKFPSGIKAAELVVTTAMTRPIFSLGISRCSWLKKMML